MESLVVAVGPCRRPVEHRSCSMRERRADRSLSSPGTATRPRSPWSNSSKPRRNRSLWSISPRERRGRSWIVSTSSPLTEACNGIDRIIFDAFVGGGPERDIYTVDFNDTSADLPVLVTSGRHRSYSPDNGSSMYRKNGHPGGSRNATWPPVPRQTDKRQLARVEAVALGSGRVRVHAWNYRTGSASYKLLCCIGEVSQQETRQWIGGASSGDSSLSWPVLP